MGLHHWKEFDIRKSKYNNFQVSGILPKQYENEIAGGDTCLIKNGMTKKGAVSLAKKESKKSKWHEVQIKEFDQYNDCVGHWYFKNGEQTYDMSV